MINTTKMLAAGLCLATTLSIGASAFADDMTTTTTTTQTTTTDSNVPASAIDTGLGDFNHRLSADLKNRPAPQVGETRAAVEAVFGPEQTALAPNKDYSIYTNEYQLVDGKMFQRSISPNKLRVYQVTYAETNNLKAGDDKVTDVKERVIPAIGDNKNLVYKFLGAPLNTSSIQPNHLVFDIPKDRYKYYSDVLGTPFEAVNAYFNADGNLVGQEFMPGSYQGQSVLTSAGRFVEFETSYQPDRKVGN